MNLFNMPHLHSLCWIIIIALVVLAVVLLAKKGKKDKK